MTALSTLWFSPVVWSYHPTAAAPALAVVLGKVSRRPALAWAVACVWIAAISLLSLNVARAWGDLLWLSLALGAMLAWSGEGLEIRDWGYDVPLSLWERVGVRGTRRRFRRSVATPVELPLNPALSRRERGTAYTPPWQFVKVQLCLPLSNTISSPGRASPPWERCSSRVLGMVRDISMAALFGGTAVMDAFVIANRIPNLFRELFGEGALTAGYLPVLAACLERDRRSAWQLASTMLVWLAATLCWTGARRRGRPGRALARLGRPTAWTCFWA